MRIWLYALCWNEERILPYFLRHYAQFCERINIYDNYSTDQSETIINSFPNTVIWKYPSNNQIRDDIYTKIKNHCWKEARGQADFVIVCDADEFLYAEDLPGLLESVKDKGYHLYQPLGYEMMSDGFPTTDGMIYDEVKWGYQTRWMNKPCLFPPDALNEINFEPGCHVAKPLRLKPILPFLNWPSHVNIYRSTGELKLLHFRFMGLPYIQERYQLRRERLSEVNVKSHWGLHYLQTSEDLVQFFEKQKPQLTQVIP